MILSRLYRYFPVMLIVFVTVLSAGCILSRDSGSDDGGGDGGGGGGGGATVSGYIKGILPAVLTSSSSAPARQFTLDNPSDWSVRAVMLDRSVTPASDGSFTIAMYTSDAYVISVGSDVAISVTYKGSLISGHASLEYARAYSTTDTTTPTTPDVQIGLLSTGGFIIVSTGSDASNTYQGWNYFAAADYTNAIARFEAVISSSTASTSDKANAYSGKGWSVVRVSGITHSSVDGLFAQGESYHLGKLGRACSIVASGQGLSNAVTLLSAIGLSSPSYNYAAASIVGVTSAQAHALLAICYSYIGRNDLAELQATQLTGSAGSVEMQVSELLQSFGVF